MGGEYKPVINDLEKYANKRNKDRLYPKEWNTVVKTLAEQTNILNNNIEHIKKMGIPISKEEPEDKTEGNLWFKILD